MNNQTKVTGVILAGGLARRMQNRDKGLVYFRDRPMVSYAINAIAPVCDQLIINANRNIDSYRNFGFPVIADQSENFDGPLAGILTAMIYAGQGLLLATPCDSPFLKARHLQKLLRVRAENDADVAVAFDGARLHPVFLAVKIELKDGLQRYLDSGQRKLETWLQQQKLVTADFSEEPELFINLNTMDELTDWEKSGKK